MKDLFKTKNILMFLGFLLLGAFITMSFDSVIGFLPSAGMALAAIPLTSLDHDEDSCNMAGIATIVYVAKVNDIQNWPLLPTNKILPEHTVDLAGDFIMNNGAFFYTYYSTQEMGEFKSDLAGNRDGEYFEISGNFFYPNTNKKALGMANLFKNADVVIILKEFSGTGNGQMRVIGSVNLPARIKPSEASGKAFSDSKGITFNFEAKSCSVPMVYSGTILTEAGQIATPTLIDNISYTIDGNVNTRFIYEDTNPNADVVAYNNCPAGLNIRLENHSTLPGAELRPIIYGGADILISPNEYADLFFVEDNMPSLINKGTLS